MEAPGGKQSPRTKLVSKGIPDPIPGIMEV